MLVVFQYGGLARIPRPFRVCMLTDGLALPRAASETFRRIYNVTHQAKKGPSGKDVPELRQKISIVFVALCIRSL
jgi:hypothetical protein